MRKTATHAQLQHHEDSGRTDRWERPISVTTNVSPPVPITYENAVTGNEPQGTAVLRCAACDAVFDMRLRSMAERRMRDKGRRILFAPLAVAGALVIFYLLYLLIGPLGEWINDSEPSGLVVVLASFGMLLVGGALVFTGATMLVIATTIAFAHDRSATEIQLRPPHRPLGTRHVVKLTYETRQK